LWKKQITSIINNDSQYELWQKIKTKLFDLNIYSNLNGNKAHTSSCGKSKKLGGGITAAACKGPISATNHQWSVRKKTH